jgi:nucleotide-binding universal stress UspA family protein
MKSMLILTDFSEAAFRAAEYACELAGSLHIKRIVLYHAYKTTLPATDLPPDMVDINNEQIHRESMEALGLLHDRLRSMVEQTVTIDMLAEDTVLVDRADLIRERSRTEAIDLIVMGVSGKSGLEKLLLGSTTAAVLKSVELPVLIVPENIMLGKALNTIVFTSDLKEVDAVPIQLLYYFLDALGGKLAVINVEKKAAEKYVPEMENAIAGLHELLSGYKPSFHYIKGNDIVEEILFFAEGQQPSLVVAVHQQHGFWSRLFHESITKKLAYNSRVPLLSLPALTNNKQ